MSDVTKGNDGNNGNQRNNSKTLDSTSVGFEIVGGGDDDEDGDGHNRKESELVTEARQKMLTKSKSLPKKKESIKEGGKKKDPRQWEYGKVTRSSMRELDYSKKTLEDDDVSNKRSTFVCSDEEEPEVSSLSSGSDNDQPEEANRFGRASGLFNTLTTGIKNITGGAILTDADLGPLLLNFKMALMTKNVAAEAAAKLTESVAASLVGKRTDRFTSMSATVKVALKESMEKLLTPKKSIDVMRDALSAKKNGKVYSIAFLGVNGVGKSTNLAKVAYYLKNKGGLRVLICACDTFRAGAVEQLKTHARCLDVELYERGYGKDPADIARQSLTYAAANAFDVVLIDTAGRMQDNELLMRAIAKLIAINNPNLVLFVGEALVGNDAIDQVTKFNRALIDYSSDRRMARGIDGMLLTKYDTVDDKVGAALSMVYVTGQPIVFVGTGQKYPHLRKLQVKEVVHALLS